MGPAVPAHRQPLSRGKVNVRTGSRMCPSAPGDDPGAGPAQEPARGGGTGPGAARTLWGFPEQRGRQRRVPTLSRPSLASTIPERARGKGDGQEKVLKVSIFNPGEGGRTLSINLFPAGSKCCVPGTCDLPSLFSIKEKQALSTSPVKDCVWD